MRMSGIVCLTNMRLASLLLFGFVFITLCCYQPSNAEVEQRIAASFRLSQLNALCAGLPKIPTLELKYKTIDGNSGVSSLSFFYSKAIPFDDAMRIYSKWFDENGWEKNRNLASTHYGYYKKDNTEIVVELVDVNTLAVSCMTENP